MFNYQKLIQIYAGHQGYSLGLESYHRLKNNKELAAHYSRLSADFCSLIVKLKNRAEKNNYLFKKTVLNEFHQFGIIQGKFDASQKLSEGN